MGAAEAQCIIGVEADHTVGRCTPFYSGHDGETACVKTSGMLEDMKSGDEVLTDKVRSCRPA
jgi:hypothetical protein